MDYIIIQAGGKGTRLGHLTKNKPKALVPVENLPMIFHLFRKYPDKQFIVIADYKKDVLKKYLGAFAEVQYRIIEASGTGTASGVGQAVQQIPAGEPFMLVWSDLILPETFELPSGYGVSDGGKPDRNYIGISRTFLCRWKYEEGRFVEEPSTNQGVAGFFLFRDKACLEGIPDCGELVRWMQEKELSFDEWSLGGTREFGLLEEYEKLEQMKCRPFNRITIEGDILVKEPVDQQGEGLAERECAWYEKAMEKQISGLPQIYDTHPLKMEYIHGKNIYACSLSAKEQRKVLEMLTAALEELHRSEEIAADPGSMQEAYYNKTMNRLSKIKNLVPFAHDEYIWVNGRKCRNVFFYRDKLERKLEKLCCDRFCFIHGDCTFSNLMLRDDGRPVLIDPRGYFGFTELYGDKRYDWAKLYYSIVGNYDRFNLKKFCLDILEDRVALEIESNGWEDMEEDFFELTGAAKEEIRLLHAVIWLSLTTYAWQDYDSICGAFYNGLYYLEEVL